MFVPIERVYISYMVHPQLASGAVAVLGFIIRFGNDVIQPHVKDFIDRMEKEIQRLYGKRLRE